MLQVASVRISEKQLTGGDRGIRNVTQGGCIAGNLSDYVCKVRQPAMSSNLK